jgi:hypothetical protein
MKPDTAQTQLQSRLLARLLAHFLGPWPDKKSLHYFLRALVSADDRVLTDTLRCWSHEKEKGQAFVVWLEGEGLLPITYDRLSQAAGSQVRQFLLNLLAPNFFLASAHTMVTLAHAREVSQLLRDAGIGAIFLKGVALAMTAYPVPTWRSMGDVDVFLQAGESASPEAGVRNGRLPAVVEQAAALLEKQGYRRLVPEMRSGHEAKLGHHIALAAGSQNNLLLELHWTLVSTEEAWYAPDMAWFLARTGSVNFEEQTYQVFTAEAMLLHLAIHLTVGHGLCRSCLKWLLDIHFLLSDEKQPLAWSEVVSGARELGWSAAVAAALTWASLLFDSPAPGNVIEQLEQDARPEMSRLIAQRADCGASRSTQSLVALGSLAGPARRRWLWNVIVPDRNYMRWRYPAFRGWRQPLAYLYRWGNIAADVCRTMVHRIRTGR